jgi:hypothetical protein
MNAKYIDDQHNLKVKQMEKKLRLLLDKIGKSFDALESGDFIDSFDRLVVKCGLVMLNYLK